MNPLLSPTALEISPAEEQARKVELLSKNESSLHKLQHDKAVIESRRQELDVSTKARNLDIVEKINIAQDDIMDALLDPDMLARVVGGTKDGLGFDKFVNGAKNLLELRQRAIQNAFDASANTGRRKRIDFAFSGQGEFIMSFDVGED